MLQDKQHVGIVTSCERVGWTDLREDIVELFQEAQESLANDARTVRSRIRAYRAWMQRTGFNTREPSPRICLRCSAKASDQCKGQGGAHPKHWFCEKHLNLTNRKEASQYKIVPLKPPADLKLRCDICGFQAHTLSSLIGHKARHDKDQQCQPVVMGWK